MPTKNAKRSTSFIRLLWPAAAANGTPVLALRMARTPHWAFGCKPDQKGASPSQALGGAGGLWRSLWLAGLLWSTARGSPAGRVQGAIMVNQLDRLRGHSPTRQSCPASHLHSFSRGSPQFRASNLSFDGVGTPVMMQPCKQGPTSAPLSNAATSSHSPPARSLLALCRLGHRLRNFSHTWPDSPPAKWLRRLLSARMDRRRCPFSPRCSHLRRACRHEPGSRGPVLLHSRRFRPRLRFSLRLVSLPRDRQRFCRRARARLHRASRGNHSSLCARKNRLLCRHDRRSHHCQRLGHAQEFRSAELDDFHQGRHYRGPQRNPYFAWPARRRFAFRFRLFPARPQPFLQFRTRHDRRPLGLRRMAVRHVQRRRSCRSTEGLSESFPVRLAHT